MSKTQLKRELAGLSKDQLIEVILDAYAARKEIKEYFEFFLNPDVGKLKDKYFNEIKKEFGKTKWGYSKVRVSKINNFLKEFEGYAPGSEHVLALRTLTISLAMIVNKDYYFTDTQENWFRKLVIKTLAYADQTDQLSRLLDIFNQLMEDSTNIYSRWTKSEIKYQIFTYDSTSTLRNKS